MVRIYLNPAEEFLLRFRPHAASYAFFYLLGFFWLLYAAVATTLPNPISRFEAFPLWIFSLLGVFHAFLIRFLRRSHFWNAFFWTLLGFVFGLVVWIHPQWGSEVASRLSFPVGLVATIATLFFVELDRHSRIVDLTTQRLVQRQGFVRRVEESFDLARFESLQASQTAWARLFGYGRLVLSSSARGKRASSSTIEIAGIPRLAEVKHRFELALADQKLPPKERQRQVEDRRLRESMRILAERVQQGTL